MVTVFLRYVCFKLLLFINRYSTHFLKTVFTKMVNFKSSKKKIKQNLKIIYIKVNILLFWQFFSGWVGMACAAEFNVGLIALLLTCPC